MSARLWYHFWFILLLLWILSVRFKVFWLWKPFPQRSGLVLTSPLRGSPDLKAVRVNRARTVLFRCCTIAVKSKTPHYNQLLLNYCLIFRLLNITYWLDWLFWFNVLLLERLNNMNVYVLYSLAFSVAAWDLVFLPAPSFALLNAPR